MIVFEIFDVSQVKETHKVPNIIIVIEFIKKHIRKVLNVAKLSLNSTQLKLRLSVSLISTLIQPPTYPPGHPPTNLATHTPNHPEQ